MFVFRQTTIGYDELWTLEINCFTVMITAMTAVEIG